MKETSGVFPRRGPVPVSFLLLRRRFEIHISRDDGNVMR